MEVTERQKREKSSERIFEEIMAKNFPNLMKYMKLHVQEGQQIPSRINLVEAPH